jgi:hypothetical protein
MTKVNISLVDIIGRSFMADIAFELDLNSGSNVYTQSGSVVVNSPVTIYTDYLGITSVDLPAGVYFVRILDARFKAIIPTSTVPVNLADLLFEDSGIDTGATFRILDEVGRPLKINLTSYLSYK